MPKVASVSALMPARSWLSSAAIWMLDIAAHWVDVKSARSPLAMAARSRVSRPRICTDVSAATSSACRALSWVLVSAAIWLLLSA